MGLTKSLGSKYAWVIAVCGFLTQVVSLSIFTSWNMNVIYAAEELGVAVTALAIVASINGVTYSGLGVFWGSLADKIGLRKELTLAAVLGGIFAVLLGVAGGGITAITIIYAAAAACAGGLSSSVIPKLIATWFDANHRGRAYPIVTIGGSLTGIVMGLVGPILITNFTWHGFYIAIGIVAFVVALILWIFMRDSPASIGTVPFGTPKDAVDVEVSVEDGTGKAEKGALKTVLKMPTTWKVSAVKICWSLWFSSNSMYVLSNVAGLGFSVVVVGLCMTVQRVCAILGILIFPSLSDKIVRKYIFAFMTIAVGLVYFAMYLAFTPDAPVAVIYLLIGLSGFFGASPSLMQACLGESFPPHLRGTGCGFVETISLIGTASGPLLAGAVINAMGGALPNFVWFCGGASILCGILGFFLLPKSGGKIGDPWVNKERKEQKELDSAVSAN